METGGGCAEAAPHPVNRAADAPAGWDSDDDGELPVMLPPKSRRHTAEGKKAVAPPEQPPEPQDEDERCIVKIDDKPGKLPAPSLAGLQKAVSHLRREPWTQPCRRLCKST